MTTGLVEGDGKKGGLLFRAGLDRSELDSETRIGESRDLPRQSVAALKPCVPREVLT